MNRSIGNYLFGGCIFGRVPANVICYQCKQYIQTKAEAKKMDVIASRASACFFGGLLCLFGLGPCGFLTACCCNEYFQTIWHSCPNCDVDLGYYQPIDTDFIDLPKR
eukprot:04410.XXX_100435_100054_1 [CDS] Oithona nana genome sequencing.